MTRVLLITTGGTPQLVTETVYALLNPTKGEPWVPDRIILATTSEGETLYITGKNEHATSLPLVGDGGRLMALYRELGHKADYVEPEILVAQLPDGEKINDVRSDTEVSAYAELLLQTVRRLTDDTGVGLHLSIAGGRKTMSFIAGQVMSLCGRAGDVMTHCLIEPDRFESSRDFWWPGNDGNTDSASASVVLHTVPFVRLRAWLDINRIFQEVPLSFGEAVDRANNALAINTLIVNFVDGSITVGDQRAALGGQNFATIATLALAKLAGHEIEWVGGHQEEYRINGDAGRFKLLFAMSMQLSRLDTIYEGNADWIGHNRFRFDSAVAPLVESHEYEWFKIPLSRLKGILQKKWKFPPSVVERMFVKPKKAHYSTGFDTKDIQLIMPDDLDLSFFDLP
jgi:CRISPR-associated protein (TIGR02584 family)